MRDKFKNLLFDIDGTLDDKSNGKSSIYQEVIKLLLEKSQLGFNLHVVTGRTFLHYKSFEDNLISLLGDTSESPFLSIIFENGHLKYERNKKTLLVDNTCIDQMEIIRKIVDNLFGSYGNRWDMKNDSIFVDYPERMKHGEFVINLYEPFKQDTPRALDKLKLFLDEIIQKYELDTLCTEAISNHISINTKGVNKLYGVQCSGINLSETIFFCDESNDIELAEQIVNAGGLVVCPENAIYQVKRYAHYVSKHNTCLGICDFLNSL